MSVLKIVQALSLIRPNAEFTQNGLTYDGLDWHDSNQIKPTENEWKNAIANFDKLDSDRKAATEAKLAALGLTIEELKLIGL